MGIINNYLHFIKLFLGFYGDPENCRWFFACLDHTRDGVTPLTAYEFRCPFGLVFNEEKLACDWPWIVGSCGQKGSSGYVKLSSGVQSNVFINGGNLESSLGQYDQNRGNGAINGFGKGFGNSFQGREQTPTYNGDNSARDYIASQFDNENRQRGSFASYPDYKVSGGRIQNTEGLVLHDSLNLPGFLGNFGSKNKPTTDSSGFDFGQGSFLSNNNGGGLNFEKTDLKYDIKNVGGSSNTNEVTIPSTTAKPYSTPAFISHTDKDKSVNYVKGTSDSSPQTYSSSNDLYKSKEIYNQKFNAGKKGGYSVSEPSDGDEQLQPLNYFKNEQHSSSAVLQTDNNNNNYYQHFEAPNSNVDSSSELLKTKNLQKFYLGNFDGTQQGQNIGNSEEQYKNLNNLYNEAKSTTSSLKILQQQQSNTFNGNAENDHRTNLVGTYGSVSSSDFNSGRFEITAPNTAEGEYQAPVTVTGTTVNGYQGASSLNNTKNGYQGASSLDNTKNGYHGATFSGNTGSTYHSETLPETFGNEYQSITSPGFIGNKYQGDAVLGSNKNGENTAQILTVGHSQQSKTSFSGGLNGPSAPGFNTRTSYKEYGFNKVENSQNSAFGQLGGSGQNSNTYTALNSGQQSGSFNGSPNPPNFGFNSENFHNTHQQSGIVFKNPQSSQTGTLGSLHSSSQVSSPLTSGFVTTSSNPITTGYSTNSHQQQLGSFNSNNANGQNFGYGNQGANFHAVYSQQSQKQSINAFGSNPSVSGLNGEGSNSQILNNLNSGHLLNSHVLSTGSLGQQTNSFNGPIGSTASVYNSGNAYKQPTNNFGPNIKSAYEQHTAYVFVPQNTNTFSGNNAVHQPKFNLFGNQHGVTTPASQSQILSYGYNNNLSPAGATNSFGKHLNINTGNQNLNSHTSYNNIQGQSLNSLGFGQSVTGTGSQTGSAYEQHSGYIDSGRSQVSYGFNKNNVQDYQSNNFGLGPQTAYEQHTGYMNQNEVNTYKQKYNVGENQNKYSGFNVVPSLTNNSSLFSTNNNLKENFKAAISGDFTFTTPSASFVSPSVTPAYDIQSINKENGANVVSQQSLLSGNKIQSYQAGINGAFNNGNIEKPNLPLSPEPLNPDLINFKYKSQPNIKLSNYGAPSAQDVGLPSGFEKLGENGNFDSNSQLISFKDRPFPKIIFKQKENSEIIYNVPGRALNEENKVQNPLDVIYVNHPEGSKQISHLGSNDNGLKNTDNAHTGGLFYNTPIVVPSNVLPNSFKNYNKNIITTSQNYGSSISNVFVLKTSNNGNQGNEEGGKFSVTSQINPGQKDEENSFAPFKNDGRTHPTNQYNQGNLQVSYTASKSSPGIHLSSPRPFNYKEQTGVLENNDDGKVEINNLQSFSHGSGSLKFSTTESPQSGKFGGSTESSVYKYSTGTPKAPVSSVNFVGTPNSHKFDQGVSVPSGFTSSSPTTPSPILYNHNFPSTTQQITTQFSPSQSNGELISKFSIDSSLPKSLTASAGNYKTEEHVGKYAIGTGQSIHSENSGSQPIVPVSFIPSHSNILSTGSHYSSVQHSNAASKTAFPQQSFRGSKDFSDSQNYAAPAIHQTEQTHQEVSYDISSQKPADVVVITSKAFANNGLNGVSQFTEPTVKESSNQYLPPGNSYNLPVQSTSSPAFLVTPTQSIQVVSGSDDKSTYNSNVQHIANPGFEIDQQKLISQEIQINFQENTDSTHDEGGTLFHKTSNSQLHSTTPHFVSSTTVQTPASQNDVNLFSPSSTESSKTYLTSLSKKPGKFFGYFESQKVSSESGEISDTQTHRDSQGKALFQPSSLYVNVPGSRGSGSIVAYDGTQNFSTGHSFDYGLKNSINANAKIPLPSEEYFGNENLKSTDFGVSTSSGSVSSEDINSDIVSSKTRFQGGITKDYLGKNEGGNQQYQDQYSGRYGKVINYHSGKFDENRNGGGLSAATNGKFGGKYEVKVEHHEFPVSYLPATNKYEEYIIENNNNYGAKSKTPGSAGIAVNFNNAKVENDKKSIIVVSQVSDANPILIDKLAGQCSCQSNVLDLRGKKQKSSDASLRRRKPKNRYQTQESPSSKVNGQYNVVVVPDSENVDYVGSSTQSLKNDFASTTAAYESITSSSVPPETNLKNNGDVNGVGNAKKPNRGKARYLPPLLSPNDGRYQDTYLLSPISANQLVENGGFGAEESRTQNEIRGRPSKTYVGAAFDRYGPGGWRSLDETLQGSVDCQRTGLFRHPKYCNKFYACHWDPWEEKFTLHVFNCPIRLTYDTSISACNWPVGGPACADDNLLV